MIIGKNGRIIGVKINDVQIWNIYPISGTGHKKDRDIFFKETLCNYMMNWKDHTKYVVQSGDHNCTHRKEDSLYNPEQHLQQSLVKHMKINGLQDDYIAVNGNSSLIYSRETNKSKTRIDYILSNTKKCTSFEYEDLKIGFDHKMAVAKYLIEVNIQKQRIPREFFWRTWVMSKELEHDQMFMEKVKVMCDMTREEIEEDEVLDKDLDISAYWKILKEEMIKTAKRKEKDLKKEENARLNYLNAIYENAIEENDINEMTEIKEQLDKIYKDKARKQVDKIRNIEINDHVYDIHKLQNQRKFENQNKITEIKIRGKTYEGTVNIVKAIQKEMESELENKSMERDDEPTYLEQYFLDKLETISLSDTEIQELIRPTEEEEIINILKNEVDLDSSPGEDGITSRFLLRFMMIDSFREIYLRYLNYTRKVGSMGKIKNVGLIIVKNKNAQSNEYEKEEVNKYK